MAIDMIESNELSALAHQRSGFKNDLQRVPKRKRAISLDSEFSNFSITTKGDRQEQAVYSKYGKPELDFSVSGMEEKGDCQGVENMITKVQQRLDLIASERGQSSNKKQSNAYNNVYNNTQSYKNDLDNLYKRMGCKVKKERSYSSASTTTNASESLASPKIKLVL